MPTRADQCEDPSSFELVANKIDARETTTISGTTKKGEVMCIGQCSVYLEYQNEGAPVRSPFLNFNEPNLLLRPPTRIVHPHRQNLKWLDRRFHNIARH